MECSYAPRGQVAAWLRRGWRLIPDHPYAKEEWAVVMVLSDATAAPLTDEEIERQAAHFRDPPTTPVPGRSNNERASWIGHQAQPARGMCAVPGCERPVEGRGWCGMHYSRWQRHGNPTTVIKPNCAHGRARNWWPRADALLVQESSC